ncbi:hypothetical protein BKP35_06485 [Anaerobacillus arseniciselenatis]|uniref:Histidine kinase/HSP90-like ATPase domain-containing protein n=1 Tax=Anaerobacillus arseniciselenatis TaxID=85682 RepID=A0A1S2LPT4_9BACI|nr:ATP-binding protein [Anaerobacillus arseniciselenatis]OIJ14522.1 hypothetical protein BKP35_06485 [Anaerobacillus arseniciselenatis]
MPTCTVPSTFKIESLEQYKDNYNLLERHLKSMCSEKNQFSAMCAFNEAINNAVVHGEFPIIVELELLSTDDLLIKIKDSGNGFPVHEKLDLIHKKGSRQLLEETLFEENGRGIYIMFEVVNEVFFNDIGNEITLIISN